MHIKSIKISNYRSFLDSGTLSFSPGFNLIVGANNVGKTSLLDCLSTRFTAEPHRSLQTLASRDDTTNPTTQIKMELSANGNEIQKLLLKSGGTRYFPWHNELGVAENLAGQMFDRIVKSDGIVFWGESISSAGQGPAWQNNFVATRLPGSANTGASIRALAVNVNAATRVLTFQHPPEVAQSDDFGHTIFQLLTQDIYRFRAERLNIGICAHGPSSELAADARNLPEVLNTLQGNPRKFREYSRIICEIFPSIRTVTTRPNPNAANEVEILVWQIDPESMRDDLAMPLTKCGTGVSQVLAMVYVAMTSERPRTIIIDEPGSFLHPGAARALIATLGTFPQHQYIIATHSPEIIAELSDAPVTIVRWEDSKSTIEQAERTTGTVASTALTEVGARLSDVFGFDNVLWVEGQSDADALKILLTLAGRSPRRTAILPVRDTGAFQRRNISEVIYIYRTLSMGDAILPPALLFLFDREGRDATQIADAEREGKGKLRFLKRRMLENYLLNAKAISRTFNETCAEHMLPTKSEDEIDKWITANGKEFCAAKDRGHEVLSNEWLNVVDGAKLLDALFARLSENRLQYRKAVHTPRLAAVLFEVDRAAADAILGIVSDVIR